MRILFISSFYPPYDLGGLEQLCGEMVASLSARGHICHVLASRHGVTDLAKIEMNVDRRLNLQADIHQYRPVDFFLRRKYREAFNHRMVSDTIDRYAPDVIFIWGMWNLDRRIPYWAEQARPCRVAYAIADYWPIEPDIHERYWQSPANRIWAEWLKKPLRKIVLSQLAWEKAVHPLALEHVACVSQYVRDKLTQAGALPHGAQVIYNGIDPTPFQEMAVQRDADRSGPLRLIYTGSLSEHKGVHTAIEACGLLRERGLDEEIHLTIVGGGHPDYVRWLKQRVDELDIGESVTLTGRVPRSEVSSILAGHHVFLFTSVYEEPIARSVMEAMAAGLAMVGTAVGGQAEMLQDGVNALIYSPNDADGLARCIASLMIDSDLRSNLAQAGQRMVLQRFTLERMVDEMEDWLTDMVTGHTG